MIKVIVLDRDGVINYDSPAFIKSSAEWLAIPGSLEAIAKLNTAKLKVAIASNQSGIAKGYFSLETLAAIHEKMQAELANVGGHIDNIHFCPHNPQDNCLCRKPKPGLLIQIAEHFAVNANEMLFIGDSIRDLQTAQAFGCKAILVKTGNGEQLAHNEIFKLPYFENVIYIADNLATAVHHILTSPLIP